MLEEVSSYKGNSEGGCDLYCRIVQKMHVWDYERGKECDSQMSLASHKSIQDGIAVCESLIQ